MNCYYWIYFLVVVLAFLYDRKQKSEAKERIFWVACSLLITLYAVQGIGSSPDFENYFKQFRDIREASWIGLINYDWELGFVYLIKLIISLFYYPRAVILCLALVIQIPIFVWIYRESPMPITSIVVFIAMGFWCTAMGIYRQWCANSILILSYRFIKQRDVKRFLILIAVAALFHRTSVVFAIVYFVYNCKISKKLIAWSLVLSLGLAVAGKPIMDVLNLFARIPVEQSFNGGITLYCVLWVLMILSYCLLSERLEEPQIKLPVIMLLVAATVQSVSFTFPLWSRVTWYFSISTVLLIPQLFLAVTSTTEKNKILALLRKYNVSQYTGIQNMMNTEAFNVAMKTVLFVVLFVWFTVSIRGYSYTFAGIN